MATLRMRAPTRTTVTRSSSSWISNGRKPAVATTVRYSAHRRSRHSPTASTPSITQYASAVSAEHRDRRAVEVEHAVQRAAHDVVARGRARVAGHAVEPVRRVSRVGLQVEQARVEHEQRDRQQTEHHGVDATVDRDQPQQDRVVERLASPGEVEGAELRHRLVGRGTSEGGKPSTHTSQRRQRDSRRPSGVSTPISRSAAATRSTCAAGVQWPRIEHTHVSACQRLGINRTAQR